MHVKHVWGHIRLGAYSVSQSEPSVAVLAESAKDGSSTEGHNVLGVCMCVCVCVCERERDRERERERKRESEYAVV